MSICESTFYFYSLENIFPFSCSPLECFEHNIGHIFERGTLHTISCNKCTWWFEYYYTFPFFPSNLISDYSTQQLSAVNDSPGGGIGTGIFLDYNNQYSSKTRGKLSNTDAEFGGETVTNSQAGENLDFSAPSLYTNASGGLGTACSFHMVLVLAISAVTSILFSHSQHWWLSPRSQNNIYRSKKFMHNVNVHVLKLQTKYIDSFRFLRRKDISCSCSSYNKNKEGSIDCVLCI